MAGLRLKSTNPDLITLNINPLPVGSSLLYSNSSNNITIRNSAGEDAVVATIPPAYQKALLDGVLEHLKAKFKQGIYQGSITIASEVSLFDTVFKDKLNKELLSEAFRVDSAEVTYKLNSENFPWLMTTTFHYKLKDFGFVELVKGT